MTYRKDYLVVGEDHTDGRKAERLGYYQADDEHDAAQAASGDSPGWMFYLVIPEDAVHCIEAQAL